MQLQCHRACVSLVIEAVLLPIGLGQPLGIGGAEVALQLLGIKVGMRSCLVPPCFNDAHGTAQLLMSGRAWPGSAAPSVVGDGLHLSCWVVSGEENHHRRGRRRKSQASHRLSQASDAADSCVVSGPSHPPVCTSTAAICSCVPMVLCFETLLRLLPQHV